MIIGSRIEFLEVKKIIQVLEDDREQTYYLCLCDCGNYIWLSEADMQRQSYCGCKFYEDLNGWSYKI